MDELAKAARIRVLAAHPHLRESRVTLRMLEAARQVPGVSAIDLYERYPDYDIDTAGEQAEAAAADLIVLLHPVHWYSTTPLLKLWLDEVLAYGWAYGPGGDALRGKDLWLAASTGGSERSYHPGGYNRYFFDAFLPPYEQTAALCGLRFLPPMMLHGAHRAEDDEIEAHVATFAERLATYPRWPELEDMAQCVACEVPQSDRPEVH